MIIELTDHLRCVAEHDESFLVLLPETMAGRRVIHGRLGCPLCQAEYRIAEGVVHFDPAPPPSPASAVRLPDPTALLAFLGLEGPGGYLALLGEAARCAGGIGELLPGVHLVAVNPPEGVELAPQVSVLHAARLPLKSRCMRGVVVAEPLASDPAWQADAIRAVLPGLRATGAGPVPALDCFELLGAADGWWVGVRR